MVEAIESLLTPGADADPDLAADSEPVTAASAPPRRPRKATKRRAPKKRAAKKATPAKNTTASGQQAKFPRHSVERALRIPKAIYDQNGGNPATPKEAATFSGGTSVSGAFTLEVSSAKKYGFLIAEGGKIAPTDRARQAIAPQSENDRVNALRAAVLAAPDLSDVYNFYRGENLPDEPYFINALTERFKIPADKVPEFLQIFNESAVAAELIDNSGDRARLLDVGRDDDRRVVGTKAAPKVAVDAGSTCFVMQPFSGALGGYYDTIFKPAIEQAGLTAVRADAEIFGTGKIMDQVWRGIHSAKVLVAELTTKNANVFYELGLAHALEKPVVLVSSNQDDVPFDLRHIRVILYDMADPFWGQKLINKVADNIASALANPEEAIFRADAIVG